MCVSYGRDNGSVSGSGSNGIIRFSFHREREREREKVSFFQFILSPLPFLRNKKTHTISLIFSPFSSFFLPLASALCEVWQEER